MENINDTTGLVQVLDYIAPLPGPFQQCISEQALTETLRKTPAAAPGRDRQAHLLHQARPAPRLHHRPKRQGMHQLVHARHRRHDLGLQLFHPKARQGNHIGRVLTEKYHILSEERTIHLRTKSPEECYELLLEQYPTIQQHTTTSELAFYLGITRETFSRLRGKLVRKPKTTGTQTTPNQIKQKNHRHHEK